MPMYEYKCADCGEEYEELVPLSVRTNPACTRCGSSNTTKKVSSFAGITPAGSCSSRGGFS